MAEYHNYEEIPTEEDYELARLAAQQAAEDLLTERKIAVKVGVDLPIFLNAPEVDGMVDKWYEMDPELEDVLYDSSELRNGMFVLPESAEMRIDVRGPMTPSQLWLARRRNRWAFITRLEHSVTIGQVNFLAEFEDGTKAKVEYDKSVSWLVKLDHRHVGVAKVVETDPSKSQIHDAKVSEELARLRKESFMNENRGGHGG